jgi:hypothetical protein
MPKVAERRQITLVCRRTAGIELDCPSAADHRIVEVTTEFASGESRIPMSENGVEWGE